ncbi:MAG: hypothetical protein JEY94_13710 [Melioribacteraceae bacterium]|nr:hypothetical protein [Melioribacteraceae bacterium]
MCRSNLLFVFFIINICLCSSISAQLDDEGKETDEYPKHGIDLRISMWKSSSQTAVSVGLRGVTVDAGTGNMGGGIMYNFYPNADYAFTFSAGLLSAEVKVETFSNYTSSLIPIMMGVKYFIIPANNDQPFRPYIAGMAGALMGSQSGVSLLSVESRTETAMGGYLGFGADMVLGRLIKVHAELGYNLFTEFEQPIGSKDDYSGPEFTFGIGFIF